MGKRGRGAQVVDRADHKNGRGNARTRAKEVTDRSPGYWDLIAGDGRRWADPEDPERRAAWEEWADKILAGWPWTYGRRPDAWFTFDAPGLLEKSILAGASAQRMAAMTRAELVYHLAADEAERADIEEDWDKGIENANHFGRGTDPRTLRKIAIDLWDVPGWWFDRKARRVRRTTSTGSPAS